MAITNVRDVPAYAWVLTPATGQVRDIPAYAWLNGYYRNPSNKASKDLFLDLLNSNAKIVFSWSTISAATPVDLTATPYKNCNSRVTITNLTLQDYAPGSSTSVYYNRLPLAAAFPDPTTITQTFTATKNGTVWDLLPAINAAFGLNLQTYDIVPTPVVNGQSNIVLTVDTGSYLFVPGTTFRVVPALGKFVIITDLLGFGNILDSRIKSLIHFDGANGATSVNDLTGRTWTVENGAQLSTTSSKFGGSSLRSGNAATARIWTPDTADLHLTGDFTIEMFINPDNVTQNSFLVTKGSNACIQFYGTQFYVRPDSGTYIMSAIPHGIAAGAWAHVAVVKQGSTWTLYVGGVSKATASSALTFGTATNELQVGNAVGFNNLPFYGYIDEFEISTYAKYTANFTPPSAPLS